VDGDIGVMITEEQLKQQVEDCMNKMWKKKPRVTYEYLVLALLKDIDEKLDSIKKE